MGMRPSVSQRKGKMYCCVMCHGPWGLYKKTNGKKVRRAERQWAQKDIQKQIRDSNEK